MSNVITVPVTYTDITVPYTTHNISVTVSNGVSTGGGAGTVIGPGLSVANNFASFLNTTGQVIKDSGLNSASFWKTAGASNLLADTFIDGGFDLYFGGNTKVNNFIVYSNHLASFYVSDNIGGAQISVGDPGAGAQLSKAGMSSGLTGINSITVSGDTGGQAKMIGGHAGNVISVGAPHSAGTNGINIYTGVSTATLRLLIDENGVFKFLGSPTNTIEFNFDNITNTVVAGQGLLLSNNTAATSGVQAQNSPAVSFLGHAWRIPGATDRYGRIDQYLKNSGTSGAFVLNFDYSTTGGVTPVTIFSIGGDTTNLATTLTFKGANFSLGADTGGSFPYTIHTGAITAARQINLPVVTGTDEFSVLGLAQTFTVTKTFATSASGLMPLVIPHGVAPTGGSLVDGGLWTTTAGLFVQINGVTVGPLGAGGSAQPFSDATALMMDNVDNTKLWALQLSSITTLTTRTWTVPDFDGTFARSSGTNTFTGVQTFSSLPTIPVLPVADTDAASKKYIDDLTLPAFSTVSDGYTLSSGGAGRLLLGDNTWLAIGANNTRLMSNGTVPSWSTTVWTNSATIGDILQATSSNTYTNLASVATGNALISGGVTTANSWGKITSSHVDATIQASGLSWLLASGGTLSGANTITGTTTNTLKYVFNSLGTTITDGAGQWLANTTAAAAGAQQQSPYLTFEGQGWATTPVASQSVKFLTYVVPVQGAANPTGNLNFDLSINGAAKTTITQLASSGVIFTAAIQRLGSNASMRISSNISSSAIVGVLVSNAGNTFNATSGIVSQFSAGSVSESFAPTSGTAAFNSIIIPNIINQTGGANGQIIGINGNITITAAVNVTGFDWNPVTPSNITGNHYGIRIVPTGAFSGFGISAPTSLVHIGASTTARASLTIAHGAAPTSPVDGDMWTTSAGGAFIRINGVTKSFNLT